MIVASMRYGIIRRPAADGLDHPQLRGIPPPRHVAGWSDGIVVAVIGCSCPSRLN